MNRLMLMKLVVLMLYAGPLVAGLAGHGWRVVPAFVAVFLLWQIIMRPQDWPREPARWREPAQMAGAAARVAILIVIVAVLFGIGRGIGGIAGHLPEMSMALPLALSFLALPLARLIWSPEQEAEMDAFLDEAIDRINAASVEGEDPETAAREISPLLLLPDDTPDGPARAGVEAILSAGSTALRLRALMQALKAAPGHHMAVRRGLVLWAADPLVAEEYFGTALLADAFDAAEGDEPLMTLFAQNALPVIVELPRTWGDFPETARVRTAAAMATDPAAAQALGVLAEALDAAETEAPGPD